MIVVTKTEKRPGAKPVVVEIPESKDPFDVCNAVARGLGFTLKAEDKLHDEIMARRARGEGEDVDASPPDGEVVARSTAFPRRWSGDGDGSEVSNPGRDAEEVAESDRGTGAGLFAEVPSARTREDDQRSMVPVGMGAVPRAVGVRETSVAAYRKAKWSGKLPAQQQVIVNWLRGHVGDATRQEIARGTGLGINCVCGRVNEMLDPEVGALREVGKRRCRATGETANSLVLA